MRRALITGITGQDGSYLAELLLARGYRVHGLVRPRGACLDRIRHLLAKDQTSAERFCQSVTLHTGNLGNPTELLQVLRTVEPDEVYHLAAQTQVGVSFRQPIDTAQITGLGTLHLLEAIRRYRDETGHETRFLQASSSEQFGIVTETPQRETTPFHPRSPYGVAKVFAHFTTINYRESWNLHASCAILFNHESPRRPAIFVTRKITQAAARIRLGVQDHLPLGNLDVWRDWGFAGDYVDAMWRILQQDSPDDFVIATGQCHSVRDFCREAFAAVGLDHERFIKVDPQLFRPAEVDRVVGDASKARKLLGWQPKVQFPELVRMMVQADLELTRQELQQSRAAA
ncbi:MAG: GDP-mannose 4,6-dehydratase [Nitrospira sp.]|nr:GDP-mannose 4,6-dehydratase [Nitrospira sp.]